MIPTSSLAHVLLLIRGSSSPHRAEIPLLALFRFLGPALGFTVASIVLWYAATYFIAPKFVAARLESAMESAERGETHGQASVQWESESAEDEIPFHELSIDEQIKRSSVIAIAKYEQSSTGAIKAIFTEFLKRDPNVDFYYNIGDEYPDGQRIQENDVDYGDGVIVFFVGSPASMRLSTTYSGERVRSLGDLPLQMLREKCKAPDA